MRLRNFLRLLMLACTLMMVASAGTAWVIAATTDRTPPGPSTYELAEQLALTQNNQTHLTELLTGLKDEQKNSNARLQELEAAYNRLIGGGLLFGIVLTFLQVLALVKTTLNPRQADVLRHDSNGDP